MIPDIDAAKIIASILLCWLLKEGEGVGALVIGLKIWKGSDDWCGGGGDDTDLSGASGKYSTPVLGTGVGDGDLELAGVNGWVLGTGVGDGDEELAGVDRWIGDANECLGDGLLALGLGDIGDCNERLGDGLLALGLGDIGDICDK